jgi:hypothetical protein
MPSSSAAAQASCLQQGARELLVLGDLFGDSAGLVGFGRADAMGLGGVAQLHHALAVEADGGDVAGPGRGDDGAGAGTEPRLLGHGAELLDFARHIDWLIVDGRQHDLAAQLQRGDGNVFFLVLDDDLVHALDVGLAGPAEAHLDARQALQLQRDMLEDMGHVRATLEPLKEPAALTDATAVLDERREPALQALVEAGDHLGGAVLQLGQIDFHLQTREAGPDVRAAKHPNVSDFHGAVTFVA